MTEKNSDKKILKMILLILLIFLVIYLFLVMYFYIRVMDYKDKVYPNTYLGDYKISDVGFAYLDSRIEFYSDDILNNSILFSANGKEYSYTFRDLHFEIDKEAIIEEIINIQKELSYTNKLDRINGNTTQIYEYKFKYDKDYLISVVSEIKKQVDVNVVYDGLVMGADRNLTYNPGVEGFVLDVSKSVDKIISDIENDFGGNLKIELIGDKTAPIKYGDLSVIDTKVSSFMTEFEPYITRATNLKVALNYIDGAIIQPGEIFSFYDYAGPYDKEGYVFYYEFVGNGVCQIATTIYNTALLGGLEIVKRYPHALQSVYVPGGLDATVASYSSGWYVDFAFKNTYDYPIYISAYANGGKAYVDFWSNHAAKKGKTYSTESVKIGERGYSTYLHVYENGVEIDKKFIATTWYKKEK